MKAMNRLRKQLEQAQTEAGDASPGQLFLPRSRVGALVQAAMAQKLRLQPDFQFSDADPGWSEVLLAVLEKALTPDAELVKHKNLSDFRFSMPNTTTVALFSDWGTGRPAAEAVARRIEEQNPNFLIHLGDIYYAGFPEEAQERFLDKLPKPAAVQRKFALNANHEMYSGGHGYFETVLPAFDQPASYFSLGNDHWQLIGLDSAYKDKRLQKPQAVWVEAQLDNGGRKNILLTHHQLFSCFEEVDDGLKKDTGKFLKAGKIHAWFWGHEHKHIVYKKQSNVLARCIGHGAIPYPPPPTTLTVPSNPVAFVNRRKREGTNQCVNGFALLRFDDEKCHVDYIDEDGNVQFGEDLHSEIERE